MRVAFMGSPDFAVPALRALRQAGHTIIAVYCQPPRPSGRGQALHRCPVHIAADEMAIPVHTPFRLRGDPADHARFAALDLDVAVVAAYGLILPQPMLDAPRFGCLNIHASLLPRWRGAGPIQAAILAGDSETGITIMRMEAGLDTGPMLLSRATPITAQATTAALHDTLADLGARLIVETLDTIPPATPQPDTGATYAPKLTREDGRIDWTQSAEALERKIRAFDPWPGTFTSWEHRNLKILGAVIDDSWGEPGLVIDTALTVACGSKSLRLTRLQLPGKNPIDAAAFLRGHPLPPNTRLGA